MTFDREREDAHAEIALERWAAHREKHAAENQLHEEKWESHAQQHDSIARNLAEYKAQSNEWRGSLSDLRATFATRVEMEALDDRIAAEREERRGTSKQGVSLVAAVGLSILAAGGTVVGIVATLLATLGGQ